MDELVYSQVVSTTREAKSIIDKVELLHSPAEISEIYTKSTVGEIWQSIFRIADEAKLMLQLYDTTESGFFLSPVDVTKEEIFKALVSMFNRYLVLMDQLAASAPTLMTDVNFPTIEESLAFASRTKQMFIDNNLYTG